MVCSNDLCMSENGKDRASDSRKLGRWSSMTFEGKMGTKISMITAYCTTNNTNGLHSAFAQQLVYINQNEIKHMEGRMKNTIDWRRYQLSHTLLISETKRYFQERIISYDLIYQ